MSKEGPTLSKEESDRLNAALAMSVLASGLSPVKAIEAANLGVTVTTSSSELPLPGKMDSCIQHADTQTEPLDLSSPSPNSKKSLRVRRDSGNQSPDLSDVEQDKTILKSNLNLKISKDAPLTHPIVIAPLILQKDTFVPLLQGPHESDTSILQLQPKTFAQWSAPFKPPLTKTTPSDCHSICSSSGYSSTSGYSSESFSEAQSEVEGPSLEKLRSSLPPKKRKHIRHAKNWEDDHRRVTPLASTSSINEDDEVFTNSDVDAKNFQKPHRHQPHLRNHPKPERVLTISPKLIQEIQLAITPDEEGDLPLHIAVVQGNKEVVSRVIPLMRAARLSLDTPNTLQQTPLHLAVITGEAEIAGYLIQQGAAPDFPDRDGNTSLHLAVKHKQLDCLKILMDRPGSIDVNCKNFEGLTSLHLAVQEQSVECAVRLLDSGADIDCQDGKSGRTALHHAVETTCGPLVAELLLRGASVNQPSYAGCSPLHVASGRGHLDIVQLLVQYGADTSQRNFNHVWQDHLAGGSQSSPGGATGLTRIPGSQKRNQKASIKRKLREKVNS